MKHYVIKADYILECYPHDINDIHDEMADALIDVAEKYKAYIGGGFMIKECKDEPVIGE